MVCRSRGVAVEGKRATAASNAWYNSSSAYNPPGQGQTKLPSGLMAAAPHLWLENVIDNARHVCDTSAAMSLHVSHVCQEQGLVDTAVMPPSHIAGQHHSG